MSGDDRVDIRFDCGVRRCLLDFGQLIVDVRPTVLDAREIVVQVGGVGRDQPVGKQSADEHEQGFGDWIRSHGSLLENQDQGCKMANGRIRCIFARRPRSTIRGNRPFRRTKKRSGQPM